MDKNIRQMVLAAVFAALIFVATYLIKIPMPSTQGYVHAGDALVFLSGAAMGPFFAAAASGIGAALADVIGGYPIWAPWTFVIKALAALVMCLLWRKRRTAVFLVIGVCAGAAINLLGYFLATYVLLGPAAAPLSIIENLLQEGAGAVLFFMLYPFWQKWGQRDR